jgi:hypothetical protein
VPRGHLQDFVAILRYALADAHPSSIVPSDRRNGLS